MTYQCTYSSVISEYRLLDYYQQKAFSNLHTKVNGMHLFCNWHTHNWPFSINKVFHSPLLAFSIFTRYRHKGMFASSKKGKCYHHFPGVGLPWHQSGVFLPSTTILPCQLLVFRHYLQQRSPVEPWKRAVMRKFESILQLKSYRLPHGTSFLLSLLLIFKCSGSYFH